MKIIVIGAGIIGSLIARELTRYDCDVTVLEKEKDAGLGVSKANSAIIHAGYDDEPNTIRSKYCSKGNFLYTKLAEELDIEVKRIGSHVVAFNNEERNTLNKLYKQGIENNVPGLRILEKDELLSMEPNLNPDAIASLYAPTAAITEPWQVCIAAIENAFENGAKVNFQEEVIDIEIVNSKVRKVITNKHEYEADIIINAAGLYADKIATMAQDRGIPIFPRIGEYILLNKFTAHDIVNSIIFPTPSKMGKGILVLPTVDKGILLGPTSTDLHYKLKDLRATSKEGLDRIVQNAKHLVPSIDLRETVKIFAGSRPETPNKDFWIGPSRNIYGLFHVAGMRSPGLTSAPAIAVDVVNQIMKSYNLDLKKKTDFNPIRKRIQHYIGELSLEEYDETIKKDPLAGKIVCVCNKVTEREIVEAIKRGARTIDSVKFRTRASFGECQGGFCTNKILEILARETGVPVDSIVYNTDSSYIVKGKVRK